MKSIDLADIQALFRKVIIPFHVIERDMTLPLPDHRPDNDAEHSWALSLMALALAPEIDNSLDVGKVAVYAIVHDLVEVYAGDTSVWANEAMLATKPDREEAARLKLKGEFPKFNYLHSAIADYEAKEDAESQFVYALDKFLNLLTLAEDGGYYYHTKHRITKARYDKHLATHRLKAHKHSAVAKYYDQLRKEFDAHPEHFYRSSKDI